MSAKPPNNGANEIRICASQFVEAAFGPPGYIIEPGECRQCESQSRLFCQAPGLTVGTGSQHNDFRVDRFQFVINPVPTFPWFRQRNFPPRHPPTPPGVLRSQCLFRYSDSMSYPSSLPDGSMKRTSFGFIPGLPSL